MKSELAGRVSFTPNDYGVFEGLLLLQNNVTTLSYIKLVGVGWSEFQVTEKATTGPPRDHVLASRVPTPDKGLLPSVQTLLKQLGGTNDLPPLNPDASWHAISVLQLNITASLDSVGLAFPGNRTTDFARVVLPALAKPFQSTAFLVRNTGNRLLNIANVKFATVDGLAVTACALDGAPMAVTLNVCGTFPIQLAPGGSKFIRLLYRPLEVLKPSFAFQQVVFETSMGLFTTPLRVALADELAALPALLAQVTLEPTTLEVVSRGVMVLVAMCACAGGTLWYAVRVRQLPCPDLLVALAGSARRRADPAEPVFVPEERLKKKRSTKKVHKKAKKDRRSRDKDESDSSYLQVHPTAHTENARQSADTQLTNDVSTLVRPSKSLAKAPDDQELELSLSQADLLFRNQEGVDLTITYPARESTPRASETNSCDPEPCASGEGDLSADPDLASDERSAAGEPRQSEEKSGKSDADVMGSAERGAEDAGSAREMHEPAVRPDEVDAVNAVNAAPLASDVSAVAALATSPTLEVIPAVFGASTPQPAPIPAPVSQESSAPREGPEASATELSNFASEEHAERHTASRVLAGGPLSLRLGELNALLTSTSGPSHPELSQRRPSRGWVFTGIKDETTVKTIAALHVNKRGGAMEGKTVGEPGLTSSSPIIAAASSQSQLSPVVTRSSSPAVAKLAAVNPTSHPKANPLSQAKQLPRAASLTDVTSDTHKVIKPMPGYADPDSGSVSSPGKAKVGKEGNVLPPRTRLRGSRGGHGKPDHKETQDPNNDVESNSNMLQTSTLNNSATFVNSTTATSLAPVGLRSGSPLAAQFRGVYASAASGPPPQPSYRPFAVNRAQSAPQSTPLSAFPAPIANSPFAPISFPFPSEMTTKPTVAPPAVSSVLAAPSAREPEVQLNMAPVNHSRAVGPIGARLTPAPDYQFNFLPNYVGGSSFFSTESLKIERDDAWALYRMQHSARPDPVVDEKKNSFYRSLLNDLKKNS